MDWWIASWVWLVVIFLTVLAWRHVKRRLLWIPVALAVSSAVPLLPSSRSDGDVRPPTQVVYRFDNSRYLEMVGYGCEGAIYYVDPKRNIRTAYIKQYGRVFLPKITHADNDGDFIFLPYSDVSAFEISRDRGRTFTKGRWVGSRPGIGEVTKITVINKQAYLETKDGRLFMTSKPLGPSWGSELIDPINVLPNKVHRDYPEFQGLPTEVPKIVDYKGWTEMHCDPDLEGEPVEGESSAWNRFQQAVSAVLTKTIGYPAVWAFECWGHS